MKLKILANEAEKDVFWAEVPAILDRATQGDSFEELLENLCEAIEGWLWVGIETPLVSENSPVMKSDCSATL
ncbi:type II toxin-antitoxin system HicB family antitoxin [Thermosynechococcaceae cyanobacterium Okahandja]